MRKAQTKDIESQIKHLLAMKEEDIDLSDIPEITNWDGAVRGKFYRPVKKPVTIRLDADVLAWLRASGRGYQTRINQTLRREMRAELLQFAQGRSGRPNLQAPPPASPERAPLCERVSQKK